MTAPATLLTADNTTKTPQSCQKWQKPAFPIEVPESLRGDLLDQKVGVCPPQLRDYQQAAIREILSAWHRRIQRQLLVLPTGAGKTVVLAELIRLLGRRTLVLAHRDELIDQTVAKLLAAGMPANAIGVVKAGRDDTAHPIIVASVQTLARERRRNALVGIFGLVVVDEAHHALAESYRQILEHVGCFADDGPLLVGVTATPDRGDGRGIGDTVFQELVYTKPVLELMEAGYLCDVRAVTVRMKLSLTGVKSRHGDFAPGELAAVLTHAEAPRLVAEAYQKHASNRKGIVFTPTVEMAYAVCDQLNRLGIAAEALDGTTPPEERRAILGRLRTGEMQVVANCAVLTEGFDEPSVACIVVCRPTKSRSLFVQMIGRGMRPSPGKTNCLILDLGGNAGRHDVVTVPDIFGIPARDLANAQSVLGAISDLEEAEVLAEAEALIKGQAELVARSVELFNRNTPTAQRWQYGRALHWVALDREIGVVNIPDGYLVICPAQTGYAAILCRWRQADRPLGIATDLTDAVHRAELYIARRNLGHLARPEAAWRYRPAGDKQIAFARRMGLRPTAAINGGTLSDWILLFQARRFATGIPYEVAV